DERPLRKIAIDAHELFHGIRPVSNSGRRINGGRADRDDARIDHRRVAIPTAAAIKTAAVNHWRRIKHGRWLHEHHAPARPHRGSPTAIPTNGTAPAPAAIPT